MSPDPAPGRGIRVTATCRLEPGELTWRATRSGGPGGQHANTSDTRVEVRFDAAASQSLGPRQRARILERLGPVVVAVAADSRSQARNRELALERLCRKLADALRVAQPRRPTRPNKAARTKRLESKRRRGDVKRRRGRPGPED